MYVEHITGKDVEKLRRNEQVFNLSLRADINIRREDIWVLYHLVLIQILGSCHGYVAAAAAAAIWF